MPQKLDELYYELQVRGAERVQQSVQQTTRGLQSASGVAQLLSNKLTDLGRAVSAAGSQMAGMGGALTGLASLGAAGGPIGIAVAALGAMATAAGVVVTRLAAIREMSELRLGRLGLQFAEVIEPFRRFAPQEELQRAALTLRGAGMPVSDIAATMERLVKLSVTSGQSVSQLADALIRAGQAGRATNQDILAFGAIAPEIYEQIAASLGVSVEQVRELAAEGKITYQQLAGALEALTNEQGKFGAALAEQDATLQGQMDRLLDSLTRIGEMLGSQLIPLLSQMLSYANSIAEVFLRIQAVTDAIRIGWSAVFGAPGTATVPPRPQVTTGPAGGPAQPPAGSAKPAGGQQQPGRAFGPIPVLPQPGQAARAAAAPEQPRALRGVMGVADVWERIQQRELDVATQQLQQQQQQTQLLDQLIGLAAGGGIAVLLKNHPKAVLA